MKYIACLLAAILCPGMVLNAAPFYHPSLPPIGSCDGIGVQIRAADLMPGDTEAIAETGSHWIRTDLSWPETERSKGEYAFGAYDELAASMKRQKLRGVFTLSPSHPLYDRGGFPTSEEARSAFTKWAVAAVTHFRGRGWVWELGNEPNQPAAGASAAPAEEYVRLAKAVCEALREARLASATGGEALAGPAVLGIDLPFLERCLEAGLLEYWSALSVHPFRDDDLTALEGDYRQLRLLLARKGPKERAIPIIATSFAFRDTWDFPAAVMTNIANDIPLTIVHEWRAKASNPEDPTEHFGLVSGPAPVVSKSTSDDNDRHFAFRQLLHSLTGYRFSKELVAHDQYWQNSVAARCLLFSNGREERLAVWASTGEEQHITIPASHGLFRVTLLRKQSWQSRLAAGDDGLPLDAASWGVKILAPEKRNDFLHLAAASPRLPLEFVYQWPGEELLPIPPDAKPAGLDNPHFGSSGYSSADDVENARGLAVGTKNPLSRSVELIFGFSSPTIRLGPNKSYIEYEWVENERRPSKSETKYHTINIGNGQTLSLQQRTKLVCTNPLEVEVYPANEHLLPVRLGNPGGTPGIGVVVCKIRPFNGETWEIEKIKPFTFAPGESEKLLEFEMGTPPPPGELSVEVHQDYQTKHSQIINGTVLQRNLPAMLPVRLWEAAPPQIVAEGDPRSASKVHLSTESPASGGPPLQSSSWKLTYDFGAGQRVIRLTSQNAPVEVLKSAVDEITPIRPNALGLWIYGDGKRCSPGVRVTDATGQLFQVTGLPITWKGWRFVSLPLPYESYNGHAHFRSDPCCRGNPFPHRAQPEIEHWGGQADGRASYPLRWDTVFLLDNRSHQPVTGEIYVSSPTLLYPTTFPDDD